MGLIRTAKTIFLSAALLAACAIQHPALAEETMLLRTLQWDISHYDDAATLSNHAQTPEGTLEFIDSTTALALHMEVLRQAYHHYGHDDAQKKTLMDGLKARHTKDKNNAEIYFSYGFAKLVMNANKTGLFFLRKANDQLNTPYTSLAYGVANVDADRIFDNEPQDQLTSRKMKAIYNFKDALAYNRDDREPGVWPSFIRIRNHLKSYSAYDSFLEEDVTTILVPYGSSSSDGGLFLGLDVNEVSPSTTPQETSVSSTCAHSYHTPNMATLVHSKARDLNDDGDEESVNFFRSHEGEPYFVQVTDAKNRPIGEFTSYVGPYIMEDLEGDGQYELVVRQYKEDPEHPVQVYRWNGRCFAEDPHVSAMFK